MRKVVLLALMTGAAMVAAGCASRSNAMDKGIAMKTQIRHEEDRVWLEGVEGWWCAEKVSSVHAAQEAAMRAAGEDVGYAHLVGVSGLAFRMQVHKTMCPSAAHAFCGYSCVERSTRALPWRVTPFDVKPENTPKVREARAAVVASIDRGIPVQYGSEEDGIIIGYQKNGEEWTCLHPMRDQGRTPFTETAWPWGIRVFTERKTEFPSRRELAAEAVRQAVDMANAPPAGDYYVGVQAWDEYIRQLRELDSADEKTRNGAMTGNAWVYECLVQNRLIAAEYLRIVAPEFDAAIAEHLRQAADLYEKMSRAVLTSGEGTLNIAPYSWSLPSGESWTPEMRQEEIRRLSAAMPLEHAAIEQIAAALAAMK